MTVWPTNITANELASGRDAKRYSNETPLEVMWDRNRVAEQSGTSLMFEALTVPVTWLTVGKWDIWIPEWLATQTGGVPRRALLSARIEATGGAQGQIRVTRGPNVGTIGSALNFGVATSEVDIEAAWAGSYRDFDVEVRRQGGTAANVTTERMLCNLRFED